MARKKEQSIDEQVENCCAAITDSNPKHSYKFVFDGTTGEFTEYLLPYEYYVTRDDGEPVSGWVYFVRSYDSVKIGYTKQVKQRIQRLQTGSPHELILLMAIRGTERLEQTYHELFDRLKLCGEWFLIDGELLEFLGRHYKRQKSEGFPA